MTKKDDLLVSLAGAEQLLRECGWEDRAGWFQAKREIVKSLPAESSELYDELKTLRSVLVGMGSFSDVPMYPKMGSAMTVQEARRKQWELTERIGSTIDEILAG